MTTAIKHEFHTLTLNQGEEEPGTRGWSFYRCRTLASAMRMPGVRVIISTDPETPCRISVMSENPNISITEPCSIDVAVERMIRLMRCYNPQPVHGRDMQAFRQGMLLDMTAWVIWVKQQRLNQAQGKPVESTDNLNFILGLDPATSDNCPNVPMDPKLTGEAPFDGQDPMWFDYFKDPQ